MKQGTTDLIKTDMVIFTMWKKSHDSPANFMRLFKAQVEKSIQKGGGLGIIPKFKRTP